mmetsp:Transcript_13753/g.24035  ORF Transcript_13753/g.24035 Transcript_13753/m.24035 type:complete len:84 (+) Transcript_13753:300-551(+)
MKTIDVVIVPAVPGFVGAPVPNPAHTHEALPEGVGVGVGGGVGAGIVVPGAEPLTAVVVVVIAPLAAVDVVPANAIVLVTAAV